VPVTEIEELETRIAFQEDLLQKLDDALASQQTQLMNLQRQLEFLMLQVKELEQEIPDNTPEPPPPHY
jgi:SlyX protein